MLSAEELLTGKGLQSFEGCCCLQQGVPLVFPGPFLRSYLRARTWVSWTFVSLLCICICREYYEKYHYTRTHVAYYVVYNIYILSILATLVEYG